MRFLRTIVLAAVLLFLIYLLVAAIASYWGAHLVPDDAVPDSWAPPNSWSEWRDILIVFTGVFWVIGSIVAVALVVVLLFLVIYVRKILRENVVPAIDSLKDSLDNVRGTTEFAGETVASPLIRTYAVVKGLRTGLGAITNLPGRVRGRQKKGRR